MNCPECDKETDVKDSRPKVGNRVWRRRVCPNGHRFTTNESIFTSEDAKEEKIIDKIRKLPIEKQEILFAFINTFSALLEPRPEVVPAEGAPEPSITVEAA